jgi:hypothetical protein
MSKDNPDKPIINTINNREDAKRMDELLLEYSQKHVKMKHPNYLPLEKWWDKVQGNAEAGRIFCAVFDIKLQMVMLNYDTIEVSTAWHKIQKAAKETSEPILSQSVDLFYERMNLHRAANGYIFRFRALFDKFMGLIVLLHCPQDYLKFLSAGSKKDGFPKIVAQHPELFPEQSVKNLIESLKIFDNGYRTAEVHGSGKLRKYTFSTNPDADRYFGELTVDVWNYFIGTAKMLDKNHIGLED